MRSVIRFLATLPFLALLAAWVPVQPPQLAPTNETSVKLEESIAGPVLISARFGAVGENQSAVTGPQIEAGSTTAV